MRTIAIAGTFDTKGEEFLYVKSLCEQLGYEIFTIHTGVFEPKFEPDVSNQEILETIGCNLVEVVSKKDRALATECLSKGIKQLLPKLYAQKKFDGILSFGGSGGTALITPAMQQLPIGVPKLMVSTMAAGDTTQYIGTSDIIMMPSVVDVAGLNTISKTIFQNAVFAMAGMLGFGGKLKEEITQEKPLIAATMFGVTTPCIDRAKQYLEEKGYEVVVFHATGVGGRTMEKLIKEGFFVGVLDLTTTEWCDEVVGGVLAAGKNRLEAAIQSQIPQVVSVGACDMVNFGAIDTVPREFQNRNLYKHNPSVTLMRTTSDECKTVAIELAKKWNQAETKMTVLLPTLGISMIDNEGQPFEGKEEREVLFQTLKNEIVNPNVEVIEVEYHINAPQFADMAASRLLELMRD